MWSPSASPSAGAPDSGSRSVRLRLGFSHVAASEPPRLCLSAGAARAARVAEAEVCGAGQGSSPLDAAPATGSFACDHHLPHCSIYDLYDAFTMPKNHITFYFDVISPWAQVGFRVLQRYVDLWDVDVQWQPLNLGRVMQISGNKPPITVQNKGRWMDEDMRRAEVFYGLKLRMPTGFPVNTQYAQCVLRSLLDSNVPSASFQRASVALMEALWTHDLPVASADDVRKILEPTKAVGSEVLEKALKEAEKKESRDRLTAESKKVVEEGAFGAPWIVVKRASDGETARFFGSDRFEQIAAFLNKPYKGPFADDSRPKL